VGTLCLVCRAASPGPPSFVPEFAPVEVETRLFLIGDAGAPDPKGEPVLAALGRELAQAPEKSFVVFLGDNVYPRGLPEPEASDRRDGERRLDAQIDAVLHAGARGFFIPGNHDWDRHGKRGLQRVRIQGAYVTARGGSRVSFLPKDGCPGPALSDEVDPHLRLVALDTHWWLHKGPKPKGPASGCDPATEPGVVESLRAALAGAGTRRVIVLAHHPLVSGGTHGGHFSLRDHLFPLRAVKGWLWLPLPIVGSVYPVLRKTGAFSQDISAPANRHMVESLESAFVGSPPFLWAAGHEHGLQVLAGHGVRWLLVSGAGTPGHTRAPSRIPPTRFASGEAGLMRLDVARNGRVRLSVLGVDPERGLAERFSLELD